MNRVDEIAKLIRKAAEAYYLTGDPIMSDREFDENVEALRKLDPNHPHLVAVGWGMKSYGKTVPLQVEINHSLPKIHSTAQYGDSIFEITPKIDGMSVILSYDEQGHLEQAVTRGDGKKGIDITAKMPYLSNYREFAKNGPNAVVRGELFIYLDTFETHLVERYANPRNGCAGIINARSFENLEHVSLLVHGIYRDGSWMPVSSCRELLECQVPFALIFDEPQPSDEYLTKLYRSYEEQNLPVDGVVLNGEMAFKVETPVWETEVVGIEWNMSSLGNYIPVVLLKPVDTGGNTFSRASGFHYGYIVENNIGPGTKVRVTLANEIIPYIVEVMK